MITTLAALALCAPQELSPHVRAARALAGHRRADEALVAGRLEEARAGFRELEKLAPGCAAAAAYGLACVAAIAGESETALAHIEEAERRGWRDAAVARWDEDLASLRGKARFESALRRMALSAAERAREPRYALASAVRARALSLHPSGERAAVAWGDGSLRLVSALDGGTTEWLAPASEALLSHVAFSPDGELLAVLDEQGWLTIRDGEKLVGRSRALEPEPYFDATALGSRLAWSPDGERVAIVDRQGNGLLCAKDGTVVNRWDSPLRPDQAVLAWLPDSSALLTIHQREVQRRDPRTGALLGVVVVCPNRIFSLALDPSCRWLATGHEDYSMSLWKLETGELAGEGRYPDPVFPSLNAITRIAFDPGGERVALSTDSGAFVHVVAALDVQEILWQSDYHSTGGAPAMDVRWSDDGARLWFAFATGEETLRSVEPEPGARAVEHFVARVPELRGGVGLALSKDLLVGLRGDGAVLWRRAQYADDAVLLLPSGHLDGEGDFTRHLRPILGDQPAERTCIYAPKRARAARAGVELLSSQD